MLWQLLRAQHGYTHWALRRRDLGASASLKTKPCQISIFFPPHAFYIWLSFIYFNPWLLPLLLVQLPMYKFWLPWFMITTFWLAVSLIPTMQSWYFPRGDKYQSRITGKGHRLEGTGFSFQPCNLLFIWLRGVCATVSSSTKWRLKNLPKGLWKLNDTIKAQSTWPFAWKE